MNHRPADRTVARQLRTAAALRRAVRSSSANPSARGRHRAPASKARIATTTATVLVIAAGAAWTGANTAQGSGEAYRTHAVDADDVIVSGCVIRFSNPDGTPSIHANGAHQCAGIESVRIDPGSGWVEVKQSVKGATDNVILFAQCQTDETLGGRRGIVCGATGGTDSTRFALHDTKLGRMLDLRDAADRERVQHRNANLWIGFFHRPGGWS